MGVDIGIVRGKGLELVGRRAERETGNLGDFSGEALRETGLCVQAGADSSAALCKVVETVRGLGDPLLAQLQLRGIAAELLSERERGRILGVCTANLDDVLPLRRLGRKG